MRGWLFGVLVVCMGCGPEAPSPKPASSSGADAPVVDAGADAEPDPGVVGDDPAPPRKRKPFPIHNSCAHVVTVVFGEDAKSVTADKRTIAPNSESEGPRDAEGKATVSLLDAKGDKLATVHVTRGMKQLEIGRSCSTLDAR